MIDKKKLAESIYALLLDKPERYRNFAEYWYLIKHLLRGYYDKDRLYLLGDYVDKSVTDRMPEFASLDEALSAAMEVYNHNASYALGSNQFEDKDGEDFTLFDPDASM